MTPLAHTAGAAAGLDVLQVLTGVGLVVAAWLFLDGAAAAGRVRSGRTALFLAGLAVVALALLSPVDTWSDDLLVVHVLQHLLLALVAAPLLVLARPLPVVLRGLPRALGRAALGAGTGRVLRLGRSPLLAPAAALAHLLVLWGGHVPAVYDAVLRTPALHALEHALVLGTAGLLWFAVLDPAGRPRGGTAARLAAVAASAAGGLVLGGALLAASSPWYDEHAGSWVHGLAPLDDQHAAGALMWGAGGPGYALAGALVVLRLLGDGRRRPAPLPDVPAAPADRRAPAAAAGVNPGGAGPGCRHQSPAAPAAATTPPRSGPRG